MQQRVEEIWSRSLAVLGPVAGPAPAVHFLLAPEGWTNAATFDPAAPGGRPRILINLTACADGLALMTGRLEPREVVLVDGILLFADARLRPLFDIRIFVDVADDVRFIRRLQRDLAERGRSVDTVIRQYLETVRPMHLEFVEPSKRHAHVILPEGGHNMIGVEMVLARVELELRRRRAAALA